MSRVKFKQFKCFVRRCRLETSFKCRCCRKKSSSSSGSQSGSVSSSSSASSSIGQSISASSSGSLSSCCNHLNYLTITGADDPIRRWWTEQGLTFPFTVANPYAADLLEFCGGVIGSIGLSATCVDGRLCLSFNTSGSAGYMLFSDCVTVGDNQCVSNCYPCSPPFSPSGTGSVELDSPVCVAGNFISQHFIIHTSNGDIYGTVTS